MVLTMNTMTRADKHDACISGKRCLAQMMGMKL